MDTKHTLNEVFSIEKLLNLRCFNLGVYVAYVQSLFRLRIKSPVKALRKEQNLTQEELAAKSGVPLKTLQQIESGMQPKGQALTNLARALFVPHSELQYGSNEPPVLNPTVVKLVNLSSLPLTVLPPFNIILPLLMIFCFKQWNPMTKQLISVQLLWTLLSFILFVLSAFSRTWLSLNRYFMLAAIVLLVFGNVAIILINAFNLDKNDKPLIRLNFNLF